MEVLSLKGRTAIIYRLGDGLVGKIPWPVKSQDLTAEFQKAMVVEKQILENLQERGTHPGIIRYHGPCITKGRLDGLTLSEANCGDLQSFLDREDINIDITTRKRWALQLAQALAYIHEMGIVHKNLSTTNVLLHEADNVVDIVLADFGASQWLELNICGDLVPDDPYRDPRLNEFHSARVDVFSLGVIIYIIMTGHYPFHGSPAPENDEMFEYGMRVQTLYQEGGFPDLSDVTFGTIIAGCCCERRFETAKEVVNALLHENID
ncbi:hypothetical protein PMIN03_012150 [Paraphaeosphaeria minitans]